VCGDRPSQHCQGTRQIPGDLAGWLAFRLNVRPAPGHGKPDSCCAGMTGPLTWGTLVAEGRAAGQDPAGFTFPGSRAGREAAFPVRRRLSPF
jgi:hypothetical protein